MDWLRAALASSLTVHLSLLARRIAAWIFIEFYNYQERHVFASTTTGTVLFFVLVGSMITWGMFVAFGRTLVRPFAIASTIFGLLASTLIFSNTFASVGQAIYATLSILVLLATIATVAFLVLGSSQQASHD